MTIFKLTERKNEIREGGPGPYVKQRIADVADSLNRAGELAARVEICNESLYKLVELAYWADSDGRAANVDTVTYRILIPLPWGSSGWKKWGLRYHESLVFRAILMGRQADHKPTQAPPLFVYDGITRSWHLNVIDYDTYAKAQAWLQTGQITLAEWKRYLRQYRDESATVQKRRRKGKRGNNEVG